MHVQDMFRLDGKVAIVTGGTSRFGRPMSEGLAEAGATVVIASRNEGQCMALADELCAQGYHAVGKALDLSSDQSITELADWVIAKYGRIDVLVNNAVARGCIGEAETLTRDVMNSSLDVNFTAQLLMTQAVLPQMKKQNSGSIIMISSVAALGAPKISWLEPEQISPTNYMMEKYGINGLTLWLAAKYGPYNIRANAICPGAFNPDLFTDPKLMGYVDTFKKHCPMGRFIEADEMKGPTVFFASEASSYCTGIILPLDGGMMA